MIDASRPGYVRDFDPTLRPRVLAFYPDPIGCSYFRVVWPFQYLSAAHLPVAFEHCGKMPDINLAPYDILVFARMWPHTWLEFEEWRKLQRAGKCVVWEQDDDVWDLEASNPVSTDVAGEIDLVTAMASECDAITTSTVTLAERFRARFPNQRIWVIPNAAFTPIFQQVTPEDRTVEGLTVGLQGAWSHYEDWRLVLEPLRRICDAYPQVTVVLCGYHPDYFDELPPDRLVKLPFVGPQEYPRQIVNVDIGLCPLRDTPFNRCKSPVKAWDFALAGAAVVASPTVYSEVIRYSETGLLATTEDQWFRCIARLIEKPKLRRELADRLKAETLARHTYQRRAGAWWQTYQHIWQGFLAQQHGAKLWLPGGGR